MSTADGTPPEEREDTVSPPGPSPEETAADGEHGSEPPAPATWAGRERAQARDGEPSDGEPAAAEPAAPAEETGFTDELDEVEQDLGAHLDEQIGADPEDVAEAEPEDAAPAEPEDEEAEPPTEAADTLALGDREAAREAALAGLRARAAAAKGKPLPERSAPQPAAQAPAPEAVAVKAEAPAASPPATAQPIAPAGEPPPKRRLWLRFVAASLLIVASMATATAVSLLVYLTQIAHELGGINNVEKQLVPVDPGKPETFLILGSDKRPGEGDRGRSDTTILLRLDPQQNAIRMLSIPRDLKVNIPGHGVNKLNAAYTYGGPKLTLEVVKQLTGLDINHVVNIDFNGFADAVNAIGCVYIDVDHHYYHSNVGVPAAEQYSAIDIPAGYQRMCGLKALEYVRYRHDDNDLVRSARQQQFLREARAEVTTSKLISDHSQLLDIFGKYTTSDINKPTTVIDLLRTFIAARNAQVQEIHFPAQLGGPTAAYVTASQSAVHQVVNQFLGQAQPVSPSPPSGTSTSSGGGGGQGNQGGGSGGGGSSSQPQPPPPPPMIDSSGSGLQYAQKVADGSLHFPIYYPTSLVPSSEITSDSRFYPIDGPGSQVYHGYTLVVSRFGPGGYYEYYDINGTDWNDAPILANPTAEKTIGGRTYQMYWDGGRLRQIAWKTNSASYWVENDLLEDLSPAEMLAIAESTKPYVRPTHGK